MAIYSSPASLHNLALHITDKNIWIRYKAIRTLHYLVSTSRGADSIIKAGFIPFLIKRLLVEEREMIGVILNILRTLLQRDVKRLAIQLGILPTLIHFVFDEFYDISSFAQDCLELVLTESNVKATIDSECLTFLKTRRYETDRETSLKSVQVYNILSASTFLRKKIAEPEIIDQILNVSWKFKTDNQIVLLCFKTLFNLCEVPIARRILERRKYFIINVFLPLEKRFRNLSMLCE
ncbi:hypothetical protein C0J52_25441 [Blattella germanica]|nr:hypothetical protein C0J52_25441 [Blattella germanica]